MKSKIIFLLLLCSVSISLYARYFNPATGRFITADTVIPGDGAALQGLNRYSYCSNNPVVRIDPDGHSDKSSSRNDLILIHGDCFALGLKNGIYNVLGKNVQSRIYSQIKLEGTSSKTLKFNLIPRSINKMEKNGGNVGLILISNNFESDEKEFEGYERYRDNVKEIVRQAGNRDVVFIEPFNYTKKHNYAASQINATAVWGHHQLSNEIDTATLNSRQRKFAEIVDSLSEYYDNLHLLRLGDYKNSIPRLNNGLQLLDFDNSAFSKANIMFADTVINWIDRNKEIETKITPRLKAPEGSRWETYQKSGLDRD